MNKAVVLAEWRRAAESLRAAESCRRDGFYADFISRRLKNFAYRFW